MYHRLVFLALPLLVYASIDNALAGHGSRSQSRSVHSDTRHATLSHHRARGADSTNGTYRSELLHSKSEWRQAQRVGNEPSSVRTVAQQFDP